MAAFLERAPRHALGYFIVTDPENGKVVDEGETLQCCHCQKHWRLQPGSGVSRGFCHRCSSVTCGKPECDRCTPWEMALERMEGRESLATALHRIRSL